MSKLIFGCGYLGERVARLWQEGCQPVHAVTRSPERAALLEAEGYVAHVADVTQPETLRDLPPVDTVLFAVGHDPSAGPATVEVVAGGVQNVLAALPDEVGRLIFISSTGVYGPAGGDWVDESTSPNPQRAGGRAALAAEQVVAAHRLASRAVILRLGGLYGPDRIPYLSQLSSGEPVTAPSQGWLNLIHIDDAAGVVLSAESWLAGQRAAETPHIFCGTDGQPVIRGNYYREVARLLGAPAPQFAQSDPALPATARASADKRVSNRKMLKTFGVRLAYRSYREGLASVLLS